MMTLLGDVAQAGSYSFRLLSTPKVGVQATSAVAGHLNADSFPDLVSWSVNSGRLSILTNNGRGALLLGHTYDLTGLPYSVAITDVNGDTKADFITADLLGNTVSVYTNLGDAEFKGSGSYPVGIQPYDLALADFNLDGWIDISTANYWVAGTVSVLTNDRAGGFVTSSTLQVGSWTKSILATDFDNDGKPDLVTADAFPSKLSTCKNVGAGCFAPAGTIWTYTGPHSLVAEDFNTDGWTDLAFANAGITLTVLTNSPDGFALAAEPPVGSVTPGTLASGDLDGNGLPDLIVGLVPGLLLITNQVPGCSFAELQLLETGGLYVIATADVNSDRRLDLIAGSNSEGSLSVFWNVPNLELEATTNKLLRISWPFPADGWSLETASNFSSEEWSPVSGEYSTNGAMISCTLAVHGANGFFRLKSSP